MNLGHCISCDTVCIGSLLWDNISHKNRKKMYHDLWFPVQIIVRDRIQYAIFDYLIYGKTK